MLTCPHASPRSAHEIPSATTPPPSPSEAGQRAPTAAKGETAWGPDGLVASKETSLPEEGDQQDPNPLEADKRAMDEPLGERLEPKLLGGSVC